MALFFVGYLISVTSTIAFIVAILTPRWIYPNNSTTDPPSPLDTNYRGIFFVDTNYGNDTCRDWVLLYKNSVSICRKGKLQIRLNSFIVFSSNRLHYCLCIVIDCCIIIIRHTSLVCWWLFVHSSSTSCAEFCVSHRWSNVVHL